MTEIFPLRRIAPLLLVASAAAVAQQSEPAAETPGAPVYEIEVIVFEHADGVRGQREDWRYIDTGREAARLAGETALAEISEAAMQDDTLMAAGTDQGTGADDTVQPDTGEPLPLEYQPVAVEDFRLLEQYQRIQRSREYRPVLHVAWRQPVYDAANETTLPLDRLASLPPTLAATASIYVNRFLHLTLDLELADARPRVDAADGLQTIVYRLNERRKMRSAELHFYDHPRFGALALISRTDEIRPLPDAPGEPDAQ